MTGAAIAAEVSAALDEVGQQVGDGAAFIVEIIRQEPPDESTSPPTPGGPQRYPFKAMQTKFSFMELSEGNTESGDVKLILEVGEIVPSTDDRIAFGGKRYSCASVDPKENAGVPYFYYVTARGGIEDV